MGLEYVEMLMRVEEEFQIAIPDEEASRMETVGALYHWLLETLVDRDSNRCLSSATFYKVRRSLMDLFGHPRRSITLDSQVDQLIPMKNRISEWERFRNSLDLRLPHLRRARWLEPSILGISLIGFVLGAWLFGPLTLFSLLFCYVAYRTTASLAVHIPPTCITVRATVKTLLEPHCKNFVDDEKTWNEKEVWETLRDAVAEESAEESFHKPEEVTKESRWVDVLDMG